MLTKGGVLKRERDDVPGLLKPHTAWDAWGDAFRNDDFDASHRLPRDDPSLREHLLVKCRE